MSSEQTIPRCYALVPCAGIGERAGAGMPKQYRAIAGRPMVAHTLDALSQVVRLDATLVVLSPGDTRFESEVPAFVGERGWVDRCGGTTRAQSVTNGIHALLARGAHHRDWVLVHDAARCLISPAWIERLIETCWSDEVGGLLALPVADTLKQERAGRVLTTIDRSDKWSAQTPQMFRIGLLREALVFAGENVTDESSAIEALGYAPRLVEGSTGNIKVTWPDDFEVAEALLRRRARPDAR